MINKIQNNYKNTTFNGNLATKATDAVSWGIKRIETGGVLVDFCFVDLLGMVIPRTYQAFTRNREELDGKLNVKNGIEELIREMFSGPSMFVIPMAFILLSKKLFGTSSNIQFKTFAALSESFKNVLKTGKVSKENFYRNLFTEAFEPHKKLNPENSAHIDENIEKIVQNLLKIEKGEARKAHIAEIKNIVSDLNKAHGINLDYSHNITLKSGVTKEVGALTADLVNYSKDIVEKIVNKAKGSAKSDLLPALFDKLCNLKKYGRRFILVSTFLATSAFLYSIPIIYKRNKQFPGINGLVKYQTKTKLPKTTFNNDVFKAFLGNKTSNVSFGQKQKNKNDISFGGSSTFADKAFKILDFNGHSVPYPILAFYTLGLMLGCRLFQARNTDERREVATRDFSGLVTIVFAIPVLRNITSTLARKISGIPVSKALKSIKAHFNPNNKPYSFENISDVYSGVSKYRNNIVDFSENISKEGGDLRKIFDFLTDDSKKALNELFAGLSTQNTSVKSRGIWKFLTKPFRGGQSELVLPESNGEIIELFKKAQKSEKYELLLEKVVKELDKPANHLVKFAKVLKSIPEAASIVTVSGFLGWFLPWFNIHYTRKLYKGKEGV
jgi:hypothetical protein